MKFKRVKGGACWGALAILWVAIFAAACHSNSTSTAIMVTVSSSCSTVSVPLQGTCQFAASVTNATDTTVTWQVNKVTGGTTTCGTISANGLYTAPSVLPSGTACGTITITAVSNQDNKATGTATVVLTSGITITISPTGTLTVGVTETFSFVATVNGAGTGFVNTVNWLVNGTQGGSSTTGTITMSTPGDGAAPAIFVAPGTVPSTATVTITAQSVADSTQIATALVTISALNTPTLTSVSPSLIPQGAVFQDLYLTGTNFLSTTTVAFAGLPITSVSQVSATVLRARIPSNLLNIAGTYTVVAAEQVGTSTTGKSVQVVPVRPAALTVLPPSFPQQSASSSATSGIELDGGYYTPSSVLEFNGQARSFTQSQQAISSISRTTGNVSATLGSALTIPGGNGAGMVTIQGVADPSFDGTFLVLAGSGTTTLRWTQTGPDATSSGGSALAVPADPSRRISATLGGLSNDLTTAGLFSVAVRTPNAAPPRSAADVVVRPMATPVVTNHITAQISKPVALGYDEVMGVPVVVNQGNNSLALLDTAFTTVTNTIAVGQIPTDVAVDSLRHSALVVDNGSSDVQAVDLVAHATVGPALSIPPGQGPPFAVGMDNVHGLAIVVGQNTTSATLLDTSGLPANPPTIVGTVGVTTGSKPHVKVLPELGWAIITPGGTGAVTVVDLVRGSTVFTAFLGATIQGVAINSETKTLLLADPSVRSASLFRLTDQSRSTIALGLGNVAVTVNPLTNTGLVVNPSLHQGLALDLGGPSNTATISLGSDPIAAQFAADSDMALVADDVDNSITVIDFGPTRSTGGDPQILQVSCPAAPPAVSTGCPTVIVSGAAAAPVPLTIIGAGFAPNAQVRLDENGSPTVTTNFVNSRMLTAMIPNSLLSGGPRRLVVDVENPTTGALSNVTNVYILQAVPVGNAPAGVAVDAQRDVAVVANTSDNTVSVVDVNSSSPTFGTVISTVTVGAAPVSVAVLIRAGRAVVANSGDSTAGVVDLTSTPPTMLFRVPIGAQPAGVAVDEAMGMALVTASGSNLVSLFSLTSSSAPQPNAVGVGIMPVAAAVAPDLGLAAVANESGGTVQIVRLTSGVPALINQVSQVAQPVGVDYDPVKQEFLVLERAGNQVLTVSAVTGLPTGSQRTGVDPSSLAYNFQSSTLLTLNTASNTLSVVDLPNSLVTDVLPLSGSSRYAVAIHPRLNLAIVSDSANNRVLLMPMAR